MSLLEMFCEVDDFYQAFAPHWTRYRLTNGLMKRRRQSQLCESEMMTILIHFQQSGYRTFKDYYTKYVCEHLRGEFPKLVSYQRFIELMPRVLVPLCVYLRQRLGQPTGIAFIDSTALAVCHNKRINRHQVFARRAAWGKTSMGWFFGFKLHLVVNEHGELLSFCLTPGNVDDRKPVPQMTQALWGKLFGDKGYISQPLFEELFAQGLQLITPIRKNMKNKLVPLMDKLLLRKRSLIETINDQLKNISQIEHSRHRSPVNFLAHLLAGLVAYTWQDKKPSLNLSRHERSLLPVAL